MADFTELPGANFAKWFSPYGPGGPAEYYFSNMPGAASITSQYANNFTPQVANFFPSFNQMPNVIADYMNQMNKIYDNNYTLSLNALEKQIPTMEYQVYSDVKGGHEAMNKDAEARFKNWQNMIGGSLEANAKAMVGSRNVAGPLVDTALKLAEKQMNAPYAQAADNRSSDSRQYVAKANNDLKNALEQMKYQTVYNLQAANLANRNNAANGLAGVFANAAMAEWNDWLTGRRQSYNTLGQMIAQPGQWMNGGRNTYQQMIGPNGNKFQDDSDSIYNNAVKAFSDNKDNRRDATIPGITFNFPGMQTGAVIPGQTVPSGTATPANSNIVPKK